MKNYFVHVIHFDCFVKGLSSPSATAYYITDDLNLYRSTCSLSRYRSNQLVLEIISTHIENNYQIINIFAKQFCTHVVYMLSHDRTSAAPNSPIIPPVTKLRYLAEPHNSTPALVRNRARMLIEMYRS